MVPTLLRAEGPYRRLSLQVKTALGELLIDCEEDWTLRMPSTSAGRRTRSRPARAELLHVLMLPALDRAERIGKYRSYP